MMTVNMPLNVYFQTAYCTPIIFPLRMGFSRNSPYPSVEDIHFQKLYPSAIPSKPSPTPGIFKIQTPWNSVVLNRGGTDFFWRSPIFEIDIAFQSMILCHNKVWEFYLYFILANLMTKIFFLWDTLYNKSSSVYNMTS